MTTTQQMPRRKGSGSTQVSVMVPDEWLARLDGLAERLSEPGNELARANILRTCIRRGMEALEAEQPETKPRKR